jgi:hypothetical protein
MYQLIYNTTHLLEQEEGCHCISQPPQPTDDLEQLYCHPEYTASYLWMVGLFPLQQLKTLAINGFLFR